MDQLAAGGFRVAERQRQVGLEVRLAARQRRASAFARGCVAGRRIEESRVEVVGLETGRDLGGRCLVRIAGLDGLEAGLGRRLEAIEERQLGEQEGQIGAEAGHGCDPSAESLSPYFMGRGLG